MVCSATAHYTFPPILTCLQFLLVFSMEAKEKIVVEDTRTQDDRHRRCPVVYRERKTE